MAPATINDDALVDIVRDSFETGTDFIRAKLMDTMTFSLREALAEVEHRSGWTDPQELARKAVADVLAELRAQGRLVDPE